MGIVIDPIPFDEFIPVPSGAQARHQKLGQYRNLTVYIYDPYSIALSKIERGLKTDIEDVRFLVRRGIIKLELLSKMAEDMLPRAKEFGLDVEQIRSSLELLSRG